MAELGSTGDGTLRILLVDDESGYVNVLQKRMGRRGIEAVTALSGSEAIQILRRQDFDAAVLDLKMEDMDGIEVLKIFKKMVPNMPVVMLTGHGSEQAARDGIRFGAMDYLTKPCELDELLVKVQRAINCQRRISGEARGTDIESKQKTVK